MMEDHDIVAPAAGPMMESMRAHGYSPATAIADIIDNSISAGARNVWLNLFWAGDKSYVSILDDGGGMDEKTLRDAMRLGSKNPLDPRNPKDLGRFGLGLKTASLSQARRLTVASQKQGFERCLRRWDLKHVEEEWKLLRFPEPGSEYLLAALNTMSQGTIVLWENVDRLVDPGTSPGNTSAQARFLGMIQEVESYLSMVFHRYLEGISPPLTIYINGTDAAHRIRSWDPFLEIHPATFKTPVETISHPNGDVRLQGFVLPHKDKVSSEEAELAAGPGGWNAQQGFYVYRNRRMLVGGGWLGLGSPRQWTQDEQYKLARILIDIPNSQDFDWQIDVKKSTAKPPTWLRDRIKALAEKVRKLAREVFAHRGAYGPRGPQLEITRAWQSKSVEGRLTYRIDRDHPLVAAARAMAMTSEQKQLFDAMLRTLEETVPVARIWLDTAEYADQHSRPFETADELEKRRLVQLTYKALRDIHGLKADAAKEKLRKTDGFQDLSHLIDAL